jgi:hypothetical protein
MKILFSVFTIFCLFLFNSCSNNSGNPTGAGGGFGGGGGGGGAVTFAITQAPGAQGVGIIFYATPTVAVSITKVHVSVGTSSGDLTANPATIYPANQPFEINEYAQAAAGQTWTFVFTGNLGSATGTAYTATSTYLVK